MITHQLCPLDNRRSACELYDVPMHTSSVQYASPKSRSSSRKQSLLLLPFLSLAPTTATSAIRWSCCSTFTTLRHPSAHAKICTFLFAHRGDEGRPLTEREPSIRLRVQQIGREGRRDGGDTHLACSPQNRGFTLTSWVNGFPAIAPFGRLCRIFPLAVSFFSSFTDAAFFTPATPPAAHPVGRLGT